MRRSGTWRAALVLALLWAAPAAARPVGFGVRLGANLADLRGNLPDIAQPKMKLGSEAGVYVDYRLSSDLALQMEADYVTKGAIFEGVGTDPGNPTAIIESRLNLQYVEIPLLLRATFRPWGSGGVRPYLIGGPTMSIGIGAKLDNDPPLPDPDLSDDLKQINWGVTGGVGLRFPTDLVRVGMESRYRTDFNDLWDIEGNLESINTGYSLILVLSF